MCQCSTTAPAPVTPPPSTSRPRPRPRAERHGSMQMVSTKLRDAWRMARRNSMFGAGVAPESSSPAAPATAPRVSSPDVEALRKSLASRRLSMSDDATLVRIETARAMHYAGVKMGQSGEPENEFEAISALEDALERIQDALGPGDEESAVVANNLWVLLHNVRVRHEELIKEKEVIDRAWREERTAPENGGRRSSMWM